MNFPLDDKTPDFGNTVIPILSISDVSIDHSRGSVCLMSAHDVRVRDFSHIDPTLTDPKSIWVGFAMMRGFSPVAEISSDGTSWPLV